MAPDKITIDLKANDKFAAELAGASPGDTVTLKEVTVLVDEVTSELLVASIQEIEDISVTPAKPGEDDEDKEDVDENSPVMQVMTTKEKRY